MAGSSSHQIKNIYVFGRSNLVKKKGVFVLARRKIYLVYGGSNLGLMGSVSTTIFLGGRQALGIIPKALAKVDIIEKIVGEELQVSTMSKRMNAMFDQVDAFIALLGTLEEIFYIPSWAN